MKPLVFGLSTLFLTQTAAADVIALKLSAGQWQPSFSGDVQDGTTRIDMEDDLGLDDDDALNLNLALEHPVPLLPNFKLDYTDLSIEATHTLTRTIDFDDTTFTVSDDITTEADLTHLDALFYYELLDNVVSLDLGLGVRQFDGYISIASSTESANVDLDDPLPLLYGAAEVELPLTGLAVSGEVKGVGYSGDSFLDMNVKASYTFAFGLGVELGYRTMSLDSSELSDIEADIDISGPYAGLKFHF